MENTKLIYIAIAVLVLLAVAWLANKPSAESSKAVPPENTSATPAAKTDIVAPPKPDPSPSTAAPPKTDPSPSTTAPPKTDSSPTAPTASTAAAAVVGGAIGGATGGVPGAAAGALAAVVTQTLLFNGQARIPLHSGTWTEKIHEGVKWAVTDNTHGYYQNEIDYIRGDGPADNETVCIKHCMADNNCALAYLNTDYKRCEKYRVLQPGTHNAKINRQDAGKLMVNIDRWNSAYK